MLSTKFSVLEIAKTCCSNKQPSNFSAVIQSKWYHCCFLTQSPLQICIPQGDPVVLQLRRTMLHFAIIALPGTHGPPSTRQGQRDSGDLRSDTQNYSSLVFL